MNFCSYKMFSNFGVTKSFSSFTNRLKGVTMAEEAVARSYNMSDGTLIETADSIIVAAERDLAEMADYGYDQDGLNAIKAIRDEFAEYPGDGYYNGEMQIAAAEKNDKRELMDEAAEDAVHRAKRKWGKDSAYVRQFQFEGYGKLRDNDRTHAARLVHKIATMRLADLATEGYTQAKLDDLAQKIQDVDEAITNKRTKISERDLATHERILKGNALYAEISKLADTGKHIWEDTHEAKYNDYVIYTTHAQGTEVIPGTPGPGEVWAVSVSFNNGNEEFAFDNTGTKALRIYFSDDPTAEPGTNFITVNAGESWAGTASQAGYTAQMQYFLVKNDDPNEAGAFELRVFR